VSIAIIPCVRKCKVGSTSISLASKQGIVMASFVLEAKNKKFTPPIHAYTLWNMPKGAFLRQYQKLNIQKTLF